MYLYFVLQTRSLKKFILLFLFIIPIIYSFSQEIFYPYDGFRDQSLQKYYRYLCDSSNNLTPDEALKKFKNGEGFKWKESKTFNIGITKNIYWFFLPIQNITEENTEAILQLNTSITKLSFYKAESNKIEKVFEGSSYTPYNQRHFKHRDLAVTLHFQPGEAAYYIFSVDKRNRNFYMPINLSSLEKTLRREEQRHWTYGIYMGIFLFIILFNIFLFFSLKDNIHLWYCGYIASEVLFINQEEKLFIEYYSSSMLRYFENANTYPFTALLVGFALKIMQLFLHQKKENSKFFTSVVLLTRMFFVIAFFIFIFSFSEPAIIRPILNILFRVVDLLFVPGLLLILISSIEKVFQRQSLATYYLITIILPFIGSTIFYLNHLGITTFNPVQPNGIVVGITAEIIMLSFLLVMRYNNFKKVNEQMLVKVNKHQQEMVQQIVNTQEEERKRIAQDLHDDVGATLSVLKLHISNLPDTLKFQNDDAKNYYDNSLKLAAKASEDIRDISHDLLPKDFNELGLFNILQSRIDTLNGKRVVRFQLFTDGDEKTLTPIHSITIYRIINEIINNIVKHSQASSATIELTITESEVQIIAEDNGIGFGTNAGKSGIGIKNITSRTEFLKGKLHIDSGVKGTCFIITIPIKVITKSHE